MGFRFYIPCPFFSTYYVASLKLVLSIFLSNIFFFHLCIILGSFAWPFASFQFEYLYVFMCVCVCIFVIFSSQLSVKMGLVVSLDVTLFYAVSHLIFLVISYKVWMCFCLVFSFILCLQFFRSLFLPHSRPLSSHFIWLSVQMPNLHVNLFELKTEMLLLFSLDFVFSASV